MLVDPTDPEDVAQVRKIQDGFGLSATGERAAGAPGLRRSSRSRRSERLALGRGVARACTAPTGCSATKEEVDAHAHLLGTAAGWGGLARSSEAYYESREPKLPVGRYTITAKDVPVDAFWSVTVYGADGFLHPNALDAYSINSVAGTKNPDGSITVTFGGTSEDVNPLPLEEGWNYTVRMYRPRPEILDGTLDLPRPRTTYLTLADTSADRLRRGLAGHLV